MGSAPRSQTGVIEFIPSQGIRTIVWVKTVKTMLAKAIKPKLAMLAVTFLLSPLSLAQQHRLEPQQRKPETLQESQAIKLSTGLVSLSVTVTDGRGRTVIGLTREDFKIYENGILQQIDFFSAEEPPVCWGIVLDRSGSMREMIRDVYRAAVHVVDEGTNEDQAFIVTFNHKVELSSDFVSDKPTLQNSILGLRAEGRTALWDAVGFALDHLKRAKHRKKALVVVTDGEDNSSRLSFRELMKRAEEADVLIYTVGMFESRGMFGSNAPSGSEERGQNAGRFELRDQFGRGFGGDYPREELTRLAEVTGASAHFPTDVEECRETMQEIASEVSHQYSLGYYPSDAAPDGKWRKLKVVVGESESKSKRKSKYVARTRTGYYAPKGENVKQAPPDGGL